MSRLFRAAAAAAAAAEADAGDTELPPTLAHELDEHFNDASNAHDCFFDFAAEPSNLVAGLDRLCSPRHRRPSDSSNEGITCV